MTKIQLNGGRWHGDPPEDISVLLEKLEKHSLDPRYEHYLDKFISKIQKEDGTPTKEVRFFGNFAEFSHVFDLRTDEPLLIEKITNAINNNLSSEGYKHARRAAGLRG